jgi:hypothetical protein
VQEVDAGQAFAMPRRSEHGLRDDRAKLLPAVGGELVGRPVESLDHLRRERHRVRHMAPSEQFVVVHVPDPRFSLPLGR